MTLMGRLEVRRGWSEAADAETAVDELASQLDTDGTFVMVFTSTRYDLQRLGPRLKERFTAPVVGCTTAGEVTPDGYRTGTITGVSLTSDSLKVDVTMVDDVRGFGPMRAGEIGGGIQDTVARMQAELPGGQPIGLLVIDGLSHQEDAVVGHLGNAIGGMPIVGGSAADTVIGNDATYVYHDGRFHAGAAVFTTLVTTHRFRPIKFQHFEAAKKRLVITGANPTTRLVHEIDGEPAADAYGRAIGVAPEDLAEEHFSGSPLILRIGGEQYVRSVQRVEPNTKSLRFFSAIDEGLVLTIARATDILPHTERALQEADDAVGGANLVLGFECLHRRMEIERRKLVPGANELARRFGVVGFHTYGEQFGTIHVNHTFTGLALGD